MTTSRRSEVMKKTIVIVLAIGIIFCLGIFTASAADAPYNGSVSGTITADNNGVISGTLTGEYNLTVTGSITGAGEPMQFTGTVSGDISGTITGAINTSGIDTMAGIIEGTGATGTVRIIGHFPQTGIQGDFVGEIITENEPPILVDSMTIGTQSGEDTVEVGSTLQMTADIVPAGASNEVAWSIHVDDRNYATIDQNGVVTGLQAGTVTVIAKALDGSLKFDQKTITIENPQTQVSGGVDPVYVIVIPASIDFGTMIKDSGIISQEICIEAHSVVIEDGYEINVGVTSDFVMKNNNGSGSVSLPYCLYNSTPSLISSSSTFTTFESDGIEIGQVKINTADITKAGAYEGTMDFVITYEEN